MSQKSTINTYVMKDFNESYTLLMLIAVLLVKFFVF